jgi:hypothetical protein
LFHKLHLGNRDVHHYIFQNECQNVMHFLP